MSSQPWSLGQRVATSADVTETDGLKSTRKNPCDSLVSWPIEPPIKWGDFEHPGRARGGQSAEDNRGGGDEQETTGTALARLL